MTLFQYGFKWRECPGRLCRGRLRQKMATYMERHKAGLGLKGDCHSHGVLIFWLCLYCRTNGKYFHGECVEQYSVEI